VPQKRGRSRAHSRLQSQVVLITDNRQGHRDTLALWQGLYKAVDGFLKLVTDRPGATQREQQSR
jgi:hypothetical protein